MHRPLLLVLALAAAVASAQYLDRSLYVPTPIGYMLESCVHRVPSGAHISAEVDANGVQTGRTVVRSASGSKIRVIPKCDTTTHPMLFPSHKPKHQHRAPGAVVPPVAPARQLLQFPPDYDGWEAYTVYHYPAGFDVMTNLFNVPTEPVDTPDVLYLFPGLQNIDWIPKVDPEPAGPFDIIQPVLQYPGDNGNYWSVKSWYVTLNAGYLVSDEIQLNVGDVIFGNQTRLDETTWYVGSTVQSSGATTSITAQAQWLQTQPWAYNTLECYGCTSCQSYPDKSPALFTDIALYSKGQLITPEWIVTPKPPQQKFCNEAAVVDSATAVHINFGNE